MSKRINGVVSDAELVFTRLHEGKIRCSIFVFDSEELFCELTEVTAKLIEDEALHCTDGELLALHFSPSSLLDYFIDGHGYHGSKTQICQEAKPGIEQLRAELQEMIDKIDLLEYVQNTTAH